MLKATRFTNDIEYNSGSYRRREKKRKERREKREEKTRFSIVELDIIDTQTYLG